MPVLAATKVILLVGDTISYRKFSGLSRLGPLCSSLRLFSGLSYQSEPLTLETLGFKNRENTRDKLKHGISAIEVPKRREKRVNPTETSAVTTKERVGVDTLAPYSKIETSRVYEKNKLKPGISAIEAPKRREKRISSVEVNTSYKKDKVDAGSLAPFAAKSFLELGLPPLLVERLEKEGFKVPTDVQAAAIPTILKDNDVVIQSYTGSGKTLAYLLPILTEVGPLKEKKTDNTDIDAVIVAPSRELAMQIVREFEKLLGPADKRSVQQLVGGANKSRQEEALKKNKPVIVVGTPGRIAELSASGKLHTHTSRFLVLDEVDELLAFNFREDMHRILEHVGRRSGAGQNVTNGGPKAKKRQTVMVSATVPFSVIRAAKSWGRDPLLVQAKSVVSLESIPSPSNFKVSSDSSSGSDLQTQAPVQSLPPSLNHYYSVTRIQHKVDTLRRCMHALDAKCVIAFMNHTKQLKDAVYKLEARGMNAAELHGDLSKLARSTILKRFRNGEVRVLLTNELSARGLDIPECDLVVNLGLPTDAIHYAHRAGRTGRLGRRGMVVTVCEESEVFVVKKIQKQLGVVIQACEFTEGNLVVNGDEKAEAL